MTSEIIQGSPEWHAIRCGKVTASRVADIMRRTKSGISASRQKYMGQLAAERLTGTVAPSFKSSSMEWGTATEEEARNAYAFYRDANLTGVAFVDHPVITMSGASPDRLVGEDGLLEIKCPDTHTHIETLLNRSIEPDYLTQMQWQMDCTGRKWCDFVSYDPRMPENLRMFVKRVPLDAGRVAELRIEVRRFISELDRLVEDLRALGNEEAA